MLLSLSQRVLGTCGFFEDTLPSLLDSPLPLEHEPLGLALLFLLEGVFSLDPLYGSRFVELRAVPLLLQLLSGSSLAVREQCFELVLLLLQTADKASLIRLLKSSDLGQVLC